MAFLKTKQYRCDFCEVFHVRMLTQYGQIAPALITDIMEAEWDKDAVGDSGQHRASRVQAARHQHTM